MLSTQNFHIFYHEGQESFKPGWNKKKKKKRLQGFGRAAPPPPPPLPKGKIHGPLESELQVQWFMAVILGDSAWCYSALSPFPPAPHLGTALPTPISIPLPFRFPFFSCFCASSSFAINLLPFSTSTTLLFLFLPFHHSSSFLALLLLILQSLLFPFFIVFAPLLRFVAFLPFLPL